MLATGMEDQPIRIIQVHGQKIPGRGGGIQVASSPWSAQARRPLSRRTGPRWMGPRRRRRPPRFPRVVVVLLLPPVLFGRHDKVQRRDDAALCVAGAQRVLQPHLHAVPRVQHLLV